MANLKLFAELRYTDRIQACFRSEGPEGSSPAREGGEHRVLYFRGPKGRHKSWRTFGAMELTVTCAPPIRTGPLTASPSDL